MRFALIGFVCLVLAACGQNSPAPQPTAIATQIPENMQEQPAGPAAEDIEEQEGTAMEERVATLGLLNKRNNVSEDFQLKPGEQRRLGDVIVRMQACERTPQWEIPKQTGAFVQLLVKARGEDGFTSVFSGWLFKESPSLNVVEHPIYDVWVKDCAMSFPGEAETASADKKPEPS